MNYQLAKKAEKLAKKISKKRTGSEGMSELFLDEAYRELTNNKE